MEFLIAFGTDDGEHLNNDHVGMAKYFYVYEFADGKDKLIEQRRNTSFTGDETAKHGDPEKARATSSVLQNVARSSAPISPGCSRNSSAYW